MALGAAPALLGDGQGARRAGGAGTQVTGHPGVAALTLPTTAVSPSSQVLRKREGRWRDEEQERGQRGKIIYQTYCGLKLLDLNGQNSEVAKQQGF